MSIFNKLNKLNKTIKADGIEQGIENWNPTLDTYDHLVEVDGPKQGKNPYIIDAPADEAGLSNELLHDISDDDYYGDHLSKGIVAKLNVLAGKKVSKNTKASKIKHHKKLAVEHRRKAEEADNNVEKDKHARQTRYHADAAKKLNNEKPVWETPDPKKESKPLTDKQKAKAKRAAKKAGRPYPNLIDNMNAAKE